MCDHPLLGIHWISGLLSHQKRLKAHPFDWFWINSITITKQWFQTLVMLISHKKGVIIVHFMATCWTDYTYPFDWFGIILIGFVSLYALFKVLQWRMCQNLVTWRSFLQGWDWVAIMDQWVAYWLVQWKFNDINWYNKGSSICCVYLTENSVAFLCDANLLILIVSMKRIFWGKVLHPF